MKRLLVNCNCLQHSGFHTCKGYLHVREKQLSLALDPGGTLDYKSIYDSVSGSDEDEYFADGFYKGIIPFGS